MSLFEKMHSLGLQADVVASVAPISADEKGRQWRSALGLLEQARSHALLAAALHSAATIRACEKGKGWQQAGGFLEEMPWLGI